MNSLKDSLGKVLNEILTLSEISKKSTVFKVKRRPRTILQHNFPSTFIKQQK